MQLKDIIARVQSKLDDPEGTYITENYVLGFAQDAYEWLYNKLRLTGYQFDEEVIVLPAVAAGMPDLGAYQAPGKELASMIQPRIIRWKLPGQNATYWRRADGPLDAIRDMPEGIPSLDNWAWIRWKLYLSKFSTPLDLEITAETLFAPLTEISSEIQIAQNANRTFSCKLAAEIAKARGNDKWIRQYSDDADEAFDDLAISLTRADQAKTRRVGRTHSTGNSIRLSSNH
jgi:hypothetical protein